MSATHNLRCEAVAVARLLEALREEGIVQCDDDALCAAASESDLIECAEEVMICLDEIEAQRTALKLLRERYEERDQKLAEQEKRIKGALLDAMQTCGFKNLPLAVGTVTAAAGRPKVTITDETRLPPEFWRQRSPEPDMRAIAEALKNGDVPGAVLSNPQPFLTVRR